MHHCRHEDTLSTSKVSAPFTLVLTFVLVSRCKVKENKIMLSPLLARCNVIPFSTKCTFLLIRTGLVSWKCKLIGA